MGWKDFLFGASEKTAPKTLTRLRWQTAYPGDEQWCGTAKAMYTPLDFTIESFGEYSAPPLALELIRDASKSFPKAVIWISLDSSTDVVVRTLNENSMIVSTEIELNPGSRVAKVISISETDGVHPPASAMPSGIQPSRAALFRRYVRLAIKNATAFRH